MTYFQKRLVAELDAAYNINATAAEAQLAREYKKVLLRIQTKIEKLYNDITTDNITSISQLYAYDRYYEIINYLNAELSKLGEREISIITPRLTHCYNSTSKLIGSQFALGNVPNTKVATDIINKIWCVDGLKWSDRVWRNQGLLRESIVQGLVDCVAAGRPSSEVAAELSKRFSVNYSNSQRLVRTELSHIQNQSALDRYSDAGITHFEVSPAMDSRCCEKCKSLYGKQVPIAMAIPGENFPPIHPNCRDIIIPVLPNMVKMKQREANNGTSIKRP